jgi:hypothetical protein
MIMRDTPTVRSPKGMETLNTSDRQELQQLVVTLRVLARTNEPNRVALVEEAIDEYLKNKAGIVRLSLERLWNAIEREEADRRVFEDWSIAREGIRSRLRRLAS